MDKPNYLLAIDLGTNTFKYILSHSASPFQPINRVEEGVFLGADVHATGYIANASVLRAQEVLRTWQKRFKLCSPVKVKAVATAALRNAENGDQVRQYLSVALGYPIEIISGAGEASLIWKGIQASGVPLAKNTMVLDIGGASTECIIGNEKHIVFKESLPFGALKWVEMMDQDPLSNPEQLAIKLIDEALQPFLLNAAKWRPQQLVGTAGSFDTWRSFLMRENKDESPFYRFERTELWKAIQYIQKLSLKERLKEASIPEYRIRTIEPAGYWMKRMDELFKFEHIYQSDFALMEGLIAELLEDI